MLCVIIFICGVLLGFALPNAFISPAYSINETYTTEQNEHYKTEVFQLCLVQAIAAAIIWLLVLFTFKDHSEYIWELEEGETDLANLNETYQLNSDELRLTANEGKKDPSQLSFVE